ncbi:DUF2207 domain-containing protein [Streptomyces sp. AC495_CC817]|uniref:DUF2207 domain-containing protein n=1 Tax=Streptomyces sp. AC495_CC817 TaxID=2823900 RepID=UPI001C2661B2|nr:DUF2207 domain-containing protein [Streptomyces sp. AC495_CC817]
MAASRFARVLAAIALSAVPLLAPVTATASEPLPATTSDTVAMMVRTDVDDFSYASWDSVFDLGVDGEGRAQLHVTETLTARFPDVDQNKGIVRGLPTTYRNAGVDLEILSVTDGDGAPVPYETEEDDGVLYVLTGDDSYVRGLTTYVIEYEMRDVVLAASTGVDEFYWDLLPLDSTQAIDAFRADIRIDDTLADRLTGNARCYVGVSGSTEECTLTRDGDRFQVTRDSLAASEGVTVAIGFEPGTVVQPAARLPQPATDIVPMFVAGGAAALAAGGWVATALFQRSRRRATGIVVAQYDVPDSLPPLLAAAIVPGARDVVPAEIVHLAVQGTLRIEEGSSEPRLRRLPGTRIPDPLDVDALDALFLDADDAGVVELPLTSETFATRMNGLVAKGQEAAAARGLTTRARSRGAVLLQWGAVVLGVIGFGLSLWGVIGGRVSAVPALLVMSFALFLVVVACFYTFSKHTVLTAEGATTYEYLMGVKEFIRVAEADRLRMLQSYTGAERRQDGTADVILVYERLLPYAMLFGLEKEWGEVLQYAYSVEQRGASWIGDPTTPFVYARLAAFTATSQAATSYTAPTASSSSGAGGSFGGGFSGGGGGGGFSGGR